MNNNEGISIGLSPREWDLIMVSLIYKKTIIVTEKGLEETDRLIQRIKDRLQEAATISES